MKGLVYFKDLDFADSPCVLYTHAPWQRRSGGASRAELAGGTEGSPGHYGAYYYYHFHYYHHHYYYYYYYYYYYWFRASRGSGG